MKKQVYLHFSEVQPNFFQEKISTKFRLSEHNTNLFALLNERNLSKPNEKASFLDKPSAKAVLAFF